MTGIDKMIDRNDGAIQRAHREIKTEKQTVLKKQTQFVGMNHIVIKVFPTILLSKN